MYVNDCVLGGWRSTVGQGLVLVEHLAKGRFPYRTEQLGQLNRLWQSWQLITYIRRELWFTRLSSFCSWSDIQRKLICTASKRASWTRADAGTGLCRTKQVEDSQAESVGAGRRSCVLFNKTVIYAPLIQSQWPLSDVGISDVRPWRLTDDHDSMQSSPVCCSSSSRWTRAT